jgi:hypothetical protein
MASHIWRCCTLAASKHFLNLKSYIDKTVVCIKQALSILNHNKAKPQHKTSMAGCGMSFYARLSMNKFFEKFNITRSEVPFNVWTSIMRGWWFAREMERFRFREFGVAFGRKSNAYNWQTLQPLQVGYAHHSVSVYTYMRHVCNMCATFEWRTNATDNCSVGSATTLLILLMPVLRVGEHAPH